VIPDRCLILVILVCIWNPIAFRTAVFCDYCKQYYNIITM
jgi:hypothetical protein